ncbi:MAG: HAD family hydrolase [Parvularculaceae bacterium]|nr:HAD family hydrolase [Parvularculaceae bacterium]
MGALGIVFDLDDTLYPERSYVRSCFQWISRRLCDASIFAELWTRFEAGDGDPIGRLTKARGIGAEDTSALISEMRAHRPEITLDPGAAELLARLRTQSRAYSIVTNGRSITQRMKVAALGLEDATAIVISEEFGASKPDASLFREVERFHAAQRHLYVGDNPAIDFEGPNSIGWETAMLIREDGIHRRPLALSPQQSAKRIIASLGELSALV